MLLDKVTVTMLHGENVRYLRGRVTGTNLHGKYLLCYLVKLL